MLTVTFVASSLLVIMTPGPDLALITRLVLRYRRMRPALAAAAGMITAGALQVAIGALGLTVLLATNPALYTGFRWVGGGVLLAFAVMASRAALDPVGPVEKPVPLHDQRAFFQGLLCTGANPKVGIFLMAFLPQFVPPGITPTVGLAVLATLYLGMGLLWLVVWTSVVHRLGRTTHGPRATRAIHAVTAVVFTLFAGRLLLGP